MAQVRPAPNRPAQSPWSNSGAAGGVIGGAVTGGAIGSFGGPLGTVIGGTIGGVWGYFAGGSNSRWSAPRATGVEQFFGGYIQGNIVGVPSGLIGAGSAYTLLNAPWWVIQSRVAAALSLRNMISLNLSNVNTLIARLGPLAPLIVRQTWLRNQFIHYNQVALFLQLMANQWRQAAQRWLTW